MNSLISILTDPTYMGLAGMFLGVINEMYGNIKNNRLNDAVSLLITGMFGWFVGARIPVAVPIYVVSIPCYFLMMYLDKKNLI